MIKIKTAIIPVAGYGSRMLPVTKAVEKCMLPVLNRPVIDYVVADCIAAGITNIVFVVGEGSDQLQRYYGHNASLEKYLKYQNKHDFLPLIEPPKGVTFAYVEQAQSGKYGTAVPVSLASHFVEDDEQVLILMGDDFVWNKDGSSELARLIKSVKNNDEAAMLGVPVEKSELSKYGVIKANKEGIFEAIIEKPAIKDAPSNLINISKYVVP
ncbi:MAG: UTP--glucose-phosphate uridylyltransferase, partial [Patescibacteria group bacterium]|nr:UTP--glucose-phosphate uridylyltransferase [Patescibacteria group bacterium]